MFREHADNPNIGMDCVCRVMCDMRQECFQCLNRTASGMVTGPPDFANVASLVETYRVSGLAELRFTWYMMTNLGAPSSTNQAVQPRAFPTSSANPKVDNTLIKRHNASSFESVSDLCKAGGDDLVIPKHNGEEVCLAWALKGSCGPNCRRKDAHVRCGRDTFKEIHALLDKCGVASA